MGDYLKWKNLDKINDDKPFSPGQVKAECKNETNNWTQEKGVFKYGYEEEAMLARKYLSKHGYNVEYNIEPNDLFPDKSSYNVWFSKGDIPEFFENGEWLKEGKKKKKHSLAIFPDPKGSIDFFNHVMGADTNNNEEAPAEGGEPLGESNEVLYFLKVKVVDENGKVVKNWTTIDNGSKQAMEEEKKHLQETSPEDSHHNRNFYKVSSKQDESFEFTKPNQYKFVVYELDGEGDEIESVKSFNNLDRAKAFAQKQTFPSHIVYVPSFDPDDDPDTVDQGEYNDFEVVWSSLSKTESLEENIEIIPKLSVRLSDSEEYEEFKDELDKNNIGYEEFPDTDENGDPGVLMELYGDKSGRNFFELIGSIAKKLGIKFESIKTGEGKPLNEVWTNGSGPGYYETIDYIKKDLENEGIEYIENSFDGNTYIEVSEDDGQRADEIVCKWVGDNYERKQGKGELGDNSYEFTIENRFLFDSLLKEEFTRVDDKSLEQLEHNLDLNGFKIVSKRDYGNYGENNDQALDIHYQIITKDGNQTKETFEDKIQVMDDILDDFEDETGSPCTFNIGLQTDGYISCGFDVRAIYYKPGEDIIPTKSTKISFRDGKPADDYTKAQLSDIAKKFGVSDDEITNMVPVDHNKKESLEETKKDEWEVKLIFKDGRTKIGLITSNSEEAANFAKDQYKNNKEVKDFKVLHNGKETPFDGAYYDHGGYYQDHVGGYRPLGEDVEKEIQVRDNENIEKDAEECPLPLEMIPNEMGINLSNVEKVKWEKQDDGQLKKVEIKFNPADELEEDIEKHDTLNPKLFDGEELKPEVAEAIKKIANEFVQELGEDGVSFGLKDIILLGSNVSYNYTKDSDLDIHLIADSSALDCPKELTDKLYGAYRSIFNKNYPITIKGVPAEIYVELDTPQAKSNGIYSLSSGWVKKPEQTAIPDLDEEAFDKLFDEWEDRYFELVGSQEVGPIKEDYESYYEETNRPSPEVLKKCKDFILRKVYDWTTTDWIKSLVEWDDCPVKHDLKGLTTLLMAALQLAKENDDIYIFKSDSGYEGDRDFLVLRTSLDWKKALHKVENMWSQDSDGVMEFQVSLLNPNDYLGD